MILKSVAITNFKNIRESKLEFSDKINCLLGDNGMGKSNLLDAIYFMSFCKSFSGMNDSMLITQGETFAMVQARYRRFGLDEALTLGMTQGKRKSFKLGGKEYIKLSEHIGRYPLVMSSPQDISLIRESGETRRRWVDMALSQSDKVYLENLIKYNRALEQRNALLRDGVKDTGLLSVIDMQLEFTSEYIKQERERWIERLTPVFNKYYALISNENEVTTLKYTSQLQNGSMLELLMRYQQKDFLLRHTTVGIHRDDIEMELNGMPMRRAGSQGQCKTYVIALRLAQYEFLKETTKLKPLLLLDDIFDKLDAKRVERIMEVVSMPTFGQIFVTDTNLAHFDEIIKNASGNYRLWSVENGVFTLKESAE